MNIIQITKLSQFPNVCYFFNMSKTKYYNLVHTKSVITLLTKALL